ncbi:TPA: hypothetical protein ACG1QI_004147 [Enterobacter kobei]|nr:hypothetical protein [Enterobacter kobei]MDD9222219.1 hypothetical protein [Enterobacter kobei]MDI3141060.1 hypothetical protein [Enterobacter kobei]QIP20359.1 hypothetical protein HA514_12335 [Enterobacter kobei]HDC4310083.1 hypothetical protein [Enterobacter kobei]
MAMEIKALEQRIHALFSQSILPLLVTESSLKGGILSAQSERTLAK